ncbi:MAG TPA: DNA primase [Gammaproteobacteria bacterium]|jgi:DNA primase|nr:DNA primase [Gammaproteobacteria bacterium]HIM99224.1 DNA primase [Gammaproteobacteria bacterium]HIO33626.1 DNA primase [Gammaproteobacteria bacterium]
MRGRIPREFIDELLARLDVVEVIDRRVPLKKAGKDFKACCPFHNEKTPSFTVSRPKQFYHCFGCGVSGTAITFLMEFEHLSFPEAVEELAGEAGLEVPDTGPARSGDNPTLPLLEILGETSRYYKDQLRSHSDASTTIAYLKQRGLTGEIAARFDLGYAPTGWDNLSSTAGNEEKLDLMVKAGLISKRESGGHYDRFRARVIFPIHDSKGRVIAFGGRLLDEGEPKYLNSPETPVFHKGSELYNLHRARSAIAQQQVSIVVEGYMDVLALAQHGIDHCVATLGTATTATHLQRLFRLAPSIVFCFDGDRAGRDAAGRALEIALPSLESGRQVSFLFLPDGEDPDSVVRDQGADTFRALIESATPLPDLLFDTLLNQTDPTRMDGKARLATLARPLISRVPEGPLRELMQQRLSDLTGIAPGGLGGSPATPATVPHKRSSARSKRLSPMATAISVLVQRPQLAAGLDLPAAVVDTHDDPGVQLLTKVHGLARENPQLTTASLIERFRGNEQQPTLEKLASRNHLVDDDGLEIFLAETFATLASQSIDDRIAELLHLASERELSEIEKHRLGELYQQRESVRSDTTET